MATGGRIFRFFIFSNLFISCCAVLMAWQTYYVLGITVHPDTLWFIFFSTLSSYSFHWMLTTDWTHDTSRSQWQQSARWIHPLLLVLAATGTCWFGWKLVAHWPYLLTIALLTFLYSAPKIPHPLFKKLRQVAIAKTLFLAIIWTMATTLIPVVTSGNNSITGWTGLLTGTGGQNPEITFLLFLLNRFFLIYAICILFDLRDRDNDRNHGIRSLVTWLHPTQVRVLFRLSLFLFTLSGCLMLAVGQSILPVCLILIPGILTGLLYRKALLSYGDLLYYFVLDGLMALSAAIMWLISLAGR
ncbi:MAG: hypothetical protein ABWZ25_02670 [Chitinophagaceae bacterium]